MGIKSSKDIVHASFNFEAEGYDVTDVDLYLDKVATYARALEKANLALSQKNIELKKQNERLEKKVFDYQLSTSDTTEKDLLANKDSLNKFVSSTNSVEILKRLSTLEEAVLKLGKTFEVVESFVKNKIH